MPQCPYWHKADIPTPPAFVRYWTQSGHWLEPALNGSIVNDPTATLAVHCGNGFDAGFRPLSKYSFKPIRCCLLSLGADMRRREFISLLSGAAASWPLAVWAQQPDRVRRIGVLMSALESDSEYHVYVSDFRKELQKLGWAEGSNLRIDYRWGALNAESRQQFAIELVAMQPDLILSQNTPTTASLLQQTRTIPIVFVGVSDPIGSGFVANFPHPGGNVTGFITMEPTIASKWLGLLKEIASRSAASREGQQARQTRPRAARRPAPGGLPTASPATSRATTC